MKKTDGGARAKIKGDPTLLVHTRHNGVGRPMSRKVVTNGIISGEDFCREVGVDEDTVNEIVQGIIRILHAGYEPRISFNGEDAIRFYPCLDPEYKNMFVASQTLNGFRECVSSMNYDVMYRGESVTADEAAAESKSRKSELRCECDEVAPDQMVKCPKCGHKFRVGRKLD